MDRHKDSALTQWLVLSIQDGSQEALESLVRLWYPKLRRYAIHQMGNVEDAHDVVQETLMSMARSLGRLKDPATFPKWIYQILHRRGIDFLRRKIKRREWMKEHQTELSELYQNSSLLNIEDTLDINSALKNLDTDSALLVHLYYLEGLSLQEISAVIDIPIGTVKSRLYKCRLHLKSLLKTGSEGE